MAITFFYSFLFLLLLSCNTGRSKNDNAKNDFDSCSVAIPFDNAAMAESMVSPGYTGVLNNYWGDDTTKIDFRHTFDKGKIISSVFYYENGNIEEEYFYKCGSLHGIQKEYYENGQLAQKKPYRYGRLEGVGEMYDEKGILRQQVVFHADSIISHINYDSTGRRIEK